MVKKKSLLRVKSIPKSQIKKGTRDKLCIFYLLNITNSCNYSHRKTPHPSYLKQKVYQYTLQMLLEL